MESALDWYKSKPAVNSRNDSVRLGKNRRQSKDRELRGGRVPRRAFKGEHDALLAGKVSNVPDPDNWLQSLSSDAARNGFNFSRWRNQTFDALLQTAVQ